ncbi:MAG: DNA photolyase family protein [Casimicrobiaceae bacterium]|nr:DNA photolyase family protein [Casimicrobiaceae bacterium]
MIYERALFWFRRDLRLADNAGLARALAHARRLFCVFVFDRDILDALPEKRDRRVEFIWASVRELHEALAARGGGLCVLDGRAREAIPALATRLGVRAVFTNRDYEPEAIERDRAVAQALRASGIAFETCKDQVIFEHDELLTVNRTPFSVFTPYKNAWLRRLEPAHVAEQVTARLAEAVQAPPEGYALPPLEALGFVTGALDRQTMPPGTEGAERLFADFLTRIDRYHETRDYPGIKGPSYLSTHLRFGTVSIRRLAREAWRRAQAGSRGAEAWLSELIWRDFYFQILAHHPRVVTENFKPEFDALRWRDDPEAFAAWCEGRTGYPIVDAAMRQLNQTGYMHNRLRMVAASFLTKHLLIDWRKGERYFAAKLNDYDLAANNGGWQWAASTGCDAQPYFRIFNPVAQSRKFDPEGRFIRRYVPELAALSNEDIHAPWLMKPLVARARRVELGRDYPAPIVDHAAARARALVAFQAVRGR